MKIKAVIFDFDDTLFSTSILSYERHSIVAKKMFLKMPSREKFFESWGLPWRLQVKKLWPEIDHEYFHEVYWQNFAQTPVPMFKGTKEILEALSKKYFLAIVTSRDKKSIFHRMEMVDLNPKLFECIVSVDDSEVHKPDPRVFNSVFEKMNEKNIEKNQAIYVGDLLIDFQAAKSAGIHFVAVLTGINSKEDFLKDGLEKEFILNSVSELPDFLNKETF